MAADGSVIISIDADGKLAIKEIDNTSEKIGELGAKSENTNKDLTKLAAGAAAVSAAMIALGKEAVEAATKFEAAFARTQTIMDETEMSVNGMRSSILKLSQDSAMAATDVSDAVYNAISGSVSTKDAVDFVDQANKLSVAGFTSLASATDIMTTTLNAYGLSADKVGGISNVLITTQNLGKTTVNELSESMGRAISTASAYGVDLQNLAAAYVELTRGGIQTRMATTYLAGMFNELGDAGSKVGKIIAEQTGSSFGQLMAQGWSLGDVLQVLSNTVDGNAEAMMGLWGSQEAGKAANAIMTQSVEDFNEVLSQMNQEMAGTTGTTERAYETMTHTSEFIDQRLSNSVTNLGIAFGDGLNPTLDLVKSTLADVVDWFTNIINNSPFIRATITGLAVGVTVAAVALSLYTIKTKLATIETLKLSAAMLSNPWVWGVAAAIALATGILVYSNATNEAADKTEELTAASKRQQKELEKLQKEYDDVCEAEGKTSAAAIELKAKIDDATEAFEEGKQTVDEYRESHNRLMNEVDQKRDAHDRAIDSINEEYAGTVNLIDRLNELTSAEEQSAAAKEEIAAIVDILNGKYPDLALTYDKLTGILSMSPKDIADAAAAAYRIKKSTENWDRLGELQYEYQKTDEDLTIAGAALIDAREKVEYYDPGKNKDWYKDDYYSATFINKTTGERMTDSEMSARRREAKTELETAESDYDDAFKRHTAIIREKNEIMWELTDYYQETADQETTFVNNLTASLDDLRTAYLEVYNAALTSIQGQFNLWEKAPGVVATGLGTIDAALESQEKYWLNYESNMETLLQYSDQIPGLAEMVNSFADGSADSVNMIAGMAASLAQGDTTALAGTVQRFQNMTAAQRGASDAIALFSLDLDGFAKETTEAVRNMDNSSEAYTAAVNTIQNYIDGANSMIDPVAMAFTSVGIAAMDALKGEINFRYVGVASTEQNSIQAHATGTINASSGVSLVGEHGPELVFMNGGEHVIPANETRRMLAESYPIAPEMKTMPGGVPAAVGRTGAAQISAIIAVPLNIDGREFARATAEYVGEEMEFEVM